MSLFICPVCGAPLSRNERVYACQNGHCYDVARTNYVNLLMSQASRGRRHGDDQRMVAARTHFLEKGYYDALLNALLSVLERCLRDGDAVIDLGCGEGWYTDHIARWAEAQNRHIRIAGIDISKTAVSCLARRNRHIEAAVASTAALPFGDGSCDICLSIFAPYKLSEIARVLKTGGYLIRGFPLENHLLSFKKQIYDNVYPNKVKTEASDGFHTVMREEVRDQLRLDSPEDIANLFMMTPYYYKTSRADQEKLLRLDHLVTEIEFGIEVCQKTDEKPSPYAFPEKGRA